ncbi:MULTISPECIES: septation protein A [Pasteurellaceae]|uniref:Inner membrane-spanning protein YciB n=1 Tax=Pasteurella atlantica TaxID=2827233 RepID=A0AAW8CFL8_9PAST|nr:septation protein A [Pasteurella atlantica]MBR0572795.1 septation protein A [Pasteurella atlantica]MDP8038723.1 septation protein A [Pasteurella atlantica]MDP8040815.1 septation protein A [Pasteurella atlantica]MDP8043012.1 septation protein A [Pasteurella atlantica]MDP8045098.1 septation protein A [Pasteurella atlantica]
MKQLLEFIHLVLFFIAYKLFGTQEAAITLIIATVIQLILFKLLFGSITKMQLFVAGFVLLFGSLTAYFNDDSFLKWKVTIINGLFAFALLFSQFILRNPLIKHLLGKEIQLEDTIWNKINLGWALFFIFCMLLNIYISHFMSNDAWYTFKVFGLTGLSLIATIITGVYLYPHLKQLEENNDK